MNYVLWFLLIFRITIKNNCIMHEDNYYYKLIAVSYLHDDQADGILHN